MANEALYYGTGRRKNAIARVCSQARGALVTQVHFVKPFRIIIVCTN